MCYGERDLTQPVFGSCRYPILVAPAYRDDGQIDGIAIDPINHPVTLAAELDFVAIGHPGERSGRNSGIDQPFGQFLFKWFSYASIKFVPFSQRKLMKTKPIAHRSRFRQTVR